MDTLSDLYNEKVAFSKDLTDTLNKSAAQVQNLQTGSEQLQGVLVASICNLHSTLGETKSESHELDACDKATSSKIDKFVAESEKLEKQIDNSKEAL